MRRAALDDRAPLPSAYADGDGRFTKLHDGDTVTLLDDPYDSSYRLAGDAIGRPTSGDHAD